MRKIKLLDLFCGGGGCSMGYHRAGFQVTGVDLEKKPEYPFEFYQADAIEFLKNNHQYFDVIAASPPCQAYSAMTRLATNIKKTHVDLVAKVREAIFLTRKMYCIENVVGAPLINPILLCGSMFDMEIESYRLTRHRLFETNWPIENPGLNHPRNCRHERGKKSLSVAGCGSVNNNQYITAHCKEKNGFTPVATDDDRKKLMGIQWMGGHTLSQAIPPVYTQWIGERWIPEYYRLQAVKMRSRVHVNTGE